MASVPTKKKPDPIDVHVGQRIRARRKMLGLSQTQVGNEIGTTFQQLQKYERGTNRISMRRLLQGLAYLGVNPAVFMLRLATGTPPQPEDFLPSYTIADLEELTRKADIDKATGELLGKYRLMSQKTKLSPYAAEMGVVYQQAQKYEDGINRVAVSRLQLGLTYLEVNSSIFVMRLITGTEPHHSDFLPAIAAEPDVSSAEKRANQVLVHLLNALITPAAVHINQQG